MRYQKENAYSVLLTQQGLDSLRHIKYDAVHGAPAFLRSLLSLDPGSPHLKQIVKGPQFYPYFKDEKFLVIHNSTYDPEFQSHQYPKSQKLKAEGIKLCAWFIHPHLSCLNSNSRQLLEGLSDGVVPKPVIERIAKNEGGNSSSTQVPGFAQRDIRTIGEMRKDGEYLASILDLNKNHVDLLKNLKKKAEQHLKEQYHITDDDNVDLYFHFPYAEKNTTLHLHIRVNQGMHPFEKARSYTLAELIEGLSSGLTIDDIILDKVKISNGEGQKTTHDPQKEFGNLDGIKIINNENLHKLKKSIHQTALLYSRDDSFGIENNKRRESRKRSNSLA